MLLNTFNGLILGIFLKLCTMILAWGFEPVFETTFKSETGSIWAETLNNYLWVVIISLSLATCIVYKMISKKTLALTKERHFPLRVFPMIVANAILMVMADSQNTTTASPSFLWVSNLLEPDTITVIHGVAINLLALLSLGAYIIFIIILKGKRKSMNTPLHLSCAVTFFALSYNSPSGFFLFSLIQSVCLISFSKKLVQIIEPKE